MNHACDFVNAYDNFCGKLREMTQRNNGGDVRGSILRERKIHFRTATGRMLNAAYTSCSGVWCSLRGGKDPCHDAFQTRKDFFLHALALLETQQCRCAISNIWLEGRDPDVRNNPFQMSLDAIDPRKGHVPGNLRWVCMCLNACDCSKMKTYVAPDDDKYPSAWTPELFEAYIRSGES